MAFAHRHDQLPPLVASAVLFEAVLFEAVLFEAVLFEAVLFVGADELSATVAAQFDSTAAVGTVTAVAASDVVDVSVDVAVAETVDWVAMPMPTSRAANAPRLATATPIRERAAGWDLRGFVIVRSSRWSRRADRARHSAGCRGRRSDPDSGLLGLRREARPPPPRSANR